MNSDNKSSHHENVWTLSSEHMSEVSIRSFMQFLSMANNAHTIDITMRADGQNYSFQADFLKYMKWLPVYRNDVTGELEDVANRHLEKSIIHNAQKAQKLDEAIGIIMGMLGELMDLSKNGVFPSVWIDTACEFIGYTPDSAACKELANANIEYFNELLNIKDKTND